MIDGVILNEINKTYDKLKQLLLLEEFKSCVSNDLKIYLNDRKVDTLCLAASCADEYSITHKDTSTRTPLKTPETKLQHLPDSVSTSQFNHHARPKNVKSDFKPLSLQPCTYCKKRGHTISECFLMKWKQESKDGSHPSVLTSVRSAPKTCIKNDTLIGSHKPTIQSDVLQTYKHFISEDFISPDGDSAKFTPIRILQDIGSSQSLLLKDVISLSEKTFTRSDALIQDVECGFLNVPLPVVNLKSYFVNGPKTV